uniref:(northern house mosquito) hypothetical protein n=1 Tax=Culex pipiens TaxID=7175 RepID=A0A8D8BRN8_CULPI
MTNLLHQQFVVVTSYPGFSSKECNRNCQNQKHDDVATFVLQNDFVREDRKDANHHHLEEDEASEDSHVHWTTLINANDQQNRQNYIGQRRSHHKPKSCQNNCKKMSNRKPNNLTRKSPQPHHYVQRLRPGPGWPEFGLQKSQKCHPSTRSASQAPERC